LAVESEIRPLDRLGWLQRAIAQTEAFCHEVERDSELERGMARFGSSDYDGEIDLDHQAVLARTTLALMEEERRSILARKVMR
jgi:hypothetical protein